MSLICWNCGEDFSDLLGSMKSFEDCPNCGAALDHGKVLEEEGYQDRGQMHLYAPGQSTSGLPYQGWKIHISATPSEAYVITEQILPELMKENIYHKVIRSRRYLENEISGDGTNQHKTVVIYPKMAEHLDMLTRDFPGISGPAQFFINAKEKDEKISTNRLKSIAPELEKWDLGSKVPVHWVNRININSNQPRAKEILELLVKLIKKSDLSLAGGPQIPESQANEKVFAYKGNSTRISFRYDIIYKKVGVLLGDKRLVNQNKNTLKNRNDSWKKLSDFTKEDDEMVVGAYGKGIKFYRDIHSVLDEDYFNVQWDYLDNR